MWKQVLRNEQSPRLSSVCFWIIFLKCSFLHGSAEFTLVHSTLVPCGQNSITCAPVRQSAAHINYCLSFEIFTVQLNYYSGIWCCINGWTVPDVLKESTALIFKGFWYLWTSESESSTFLRNIQKPLSQWQGVISQKNGYLNYWLFCLWFI